ncbi:hypothetical protein [Chitinophaga sp. sic0106]|uniref:terpene synthase family protein n=1 Tax=Chitinophaga sp. sic0106 TaxID=2854785 RepID=UPI001C446AF6|nr:hypothetical protein [Chitinophaga sp. sic0106]MBV7530979.1 hypothetical protein [Chitinophaga sp. sic0106]
MPQFKLYAIPKLHCPFIPYENALLVQKVEAHTRSWLRKFSLIKSPEHEQFYTRQKFAAMIVSSYPFATEEALYVWCDLNTYLFLLDDNLDETTTINSMAAMQNLADKYFSILSGGLPNDCNDNMLIAFADIWKRLCSIGTATWLTIFIENIRDMFLGGMWQLSTALAGKAPTLKSYIEMRQYLGAAHLATDSMPLMAACQLPISVKSDQIYKNMIINVRNVICYSNDLFSLGKELGQSTSGADFNLVTVLMKTDNLTIENGITAAAKFHDDEMNQFIANSLDLMNRYPALREQLHKQVMALKYLISGNVFWSTKISTRYPHIYENIPRGIM